MSPKTKTNPDWPTVGRPEARPCYKSFFFTSKIYYVLRFLRVTEKKLISSFLWSLITNFRLFFQIYDKLWKLLINSDSLTSAILDPLFRFKKKTSGFLFVSKLRLRVQILLTERMTSIRETWVVENCRIFRGSLTKSPVYEKKFQWPGTVK